MLSAQFLVGTGWKVCNLSRKNYIVENEDNTLSPSFHNAIGISNFLYGQALRGGK